MRRSLVGPVSLAIGLCGALCLGGCAPAPAGGADGPASDTAASTASGGPQCGVTAGAPDCGLAPATMGADQKRRAEQLTSLFENRTLDLQYDYIEALGDGRGYTAGRAGFTTATGDFLEVTERYTRLVPDNPLAPYLPRLRELAAAQSDSLDGLDGLPAAWMQAAADPTQRGVQDDVVDALYFEPAMNVAACVGARHALSLAFLYDTIIQHGGGDDADSLGSILERTRRDVGGTPATGVDELRWLRALIAERRRDLARACDAATRKEWSESVDRCDAFAALVLAGSLDLDGALRVPLDGGVTVVP